jgi:CO/xanthine dehydrogenase FAD-binding subunit
MEVERPRTLKEALASLANGSGISRPTPLAGGTDLYVALNAGTHPTARFVDLWGLAELGGIVATRHGVTLGALVTFAEIRAHALMRRRFPSLVAAAAEVGARQIQNRATIAGNIANASPAGDSLPVLLAHDAVVHARSVRGAREIPFESLYRGYRDLVLAPDELITAVSLPFAAPGTAVGFRKVGTRRAQSISKVVFAARLHRDKKGRVDDVRLAFGSVAPVTVRARAAEAALLGRTPSRAAAAAARAALASDIAPIDDIRSERTYRETVAANVLEQFLRASHAGYARG